MSKAAAEVDPRGCCSVCGSELSRGRPQCSVGCALAARVPLGEDALPVSWELAGFLGSGFLLFNQALLGVASLVKQGQGEFSASQGFATGSIAVGIAWLALALACWVVSFPKRRREVGVALAAIGVIVVPEFVSGLEIRFATRFTIANSLVAIWLYRGVYYLWRASKKREK